MPNPHTVHTHARRRLLVAIKEGGAHTHNGPVVDEQAKALRVLGKLALCGDVDPLLGSAGSIFISLDDLSQSQGCQ